MTAPDLAPRKRRPAGAGMTAGHAVKCGRHGRITGVTKRPPGQDSPCRRSARTRRQALALFGHGKLSDAQAATVIAHLEACADCRKAVAGLPPDSFLGKVRAARPGAPSVPPGAAPARPGWRRKRAG